MGDYACPICGTLYDNEDEADACEMACEDKNEQFRKMYYYLLFDIFLSLSN